MVASNEQRSPNVAWHDNGTDRSVRWSANTLGGVTIWLTGLSGSGKSTVAVELERLLVGKARATYLLDGDNLRHGLNGDLGFSRADREENVRRVGEVARLFADAGLVAIVPVISPYRAGRLRAREIHVVSGLDFIEVFVDTPLDECERRDPKGLYRKARSGELPGFTGIDDPYEEPEAPDLVLRPDHGDAEALARVILDHLDTDRRTDAP